MNNSKETQCLRAANALKLQYVQDTLVALRNEGTSVLSDWNIREFNWLPTIQGKFCQAMMIALVVLLIIPTHWLFTVSFHWYELYQVKKLIRRYKKESMICAEIEHKTIQNLWHTLGVDGEDFEHICCVNLLHEWLVILYGEDIANTMDVAGQHKAICQRQIEANIPYYKGVEDAPHFHFASPFASLFEKVCDELPDYN